MTLPSLDREFEGKTAFVLGGSSGIGLASATLLAARGDKVAIVGHAEDTLAIADRLAADKKQIVVGFHGDASQADFVRSAIEGTVSRFGALDILMCSAAIHPFGDVVRDR
jgi:meso-butanediol dehydrogenase / (S,S)-butanediol dehydrogenase / diacetyl reductase